jgi:hypothetical protein
MSHSLAGVYATPLWETKHHNNERLKYASFTNANSHVHLARHTFILRLAGFQATIEVPLSSLLFPHNLEHLHHRERPLLSGL